MNQDKKRKGSFDPLSDTTEKSRRQHDEKESKGNKTQLMDVLSIEELQQNVMSFKSTKDIVNMTQLNKKEKSVTNQFQFENVILTHRINSREAWKNVISNLAYRQVLSLDLSSRTITNDADMTELRKLKHLKSLTLKYCKVTDNGLRSVSELTNLHELNLTGCRHFTHVGLDWLVSKLTHLRHLNLSNCFQLNSNTLRALAPLTKLQHLNLNGCRSISSLHLLTPLKGLKELHLLNIECSNHELIMLSSSLQLLGALSIDGINVEEDGLMSLSSLTFLEELNLNINNSPIVAGLGSLGLLNNLNTLRLELLSVLDDNNFIQDNVENLSNLKIRNLSLNGYSTPLIFNQLCSSPEQLQFIRCLDITYTNMSKSDLDSVWTMQNLEELHFPFSGTLTPSYERSVSDFLLDDKSFFKLSKLTRLKKLSLPGNIQPHQFEYLAKLDKLQELNLADCKNVTDEALETLATLANLKHLRFESCNRPTKQGLLWLVSLTKLETFAYTHSAITDKELKSVSLLASLSKLDLSENRQITDIGLTCLSSLSNLKELDVLGCREISFKGLECLFSCTKIAKLNFQYLKFTTTQIPFMD